MCVREAESESCLLGARKNVRVSENVGVRTLGRAHVQILGEKNVMAYSRFWVGEVVFKKPTVVGKSQRVLVVDWHPYAASQKPGFRLAHREGLSRMMSLIVRHALTVSWATSTWASCGSCQS